jgi:hypothetical protein
VSALRRRCGLRPAPRARQPAVTAPNRCWIARRLSERRVADREDAPWPRSPPGRSADPDGWVLRHAHIRLVLDLGRAGQQRCRVVGRARGRTGTRLHAGSVRFPPEQASASIRPRAGAPVACRMVDSGGIGGCGQRVARQWMAAKRGGPLQRVMGRTRRPVDELPESSSGPHGVRWSPVPFRVSAVGVQRGAALDRHCLAGQIASWHNERLALKRTMTTRRVATPQLLLRPLQRP